MGSSKTKKTTTTPTPTPPPPPPPPPTNFTGPTLILDTGGWTVKHGLIQNPTTTNPTTTSPPPSSQKTTTLKPTDTPNAIAKPKHQITTLIADEIRTIKQQNQLSIIRPCERGYCVDLGTQYLVWKRIICDLEHLELSSLLSSSILAAVAAAAASSSKKKKKRKRGDEDKTKTTTTTTTIAAGTTSNCCVFLLTQPFTPKVISDKIDQVLFHDFNFGVVGKRLVQCASAFHYLSLMEQQPPYQEEEQLQKEEDSSNENDNKQGQGGGEEEEEEEEVTMKPTILSPTWVNDETKCCCVVDSGFSFTHVVPTINACAVQKAIRRLNIGGKILTNLLKEQISYRQWNMMDDFAIVNDVKESTCFVSSAFDKWMKYALRTRKGLRWFDREFVLPDFVTSLKGRVELPITLRRKMEWEERERRRKREEQEEEEEKERKKKGEDGVDGEKVKKEEKDHDENNTNQKNDEQSQNTEKESKSNDGVTGNGNDDADDGNNNNQEKSEQKDNDNDDNDDDGNSSSDDNNNDDDDDDDDDDEKETQQQKLLRLKKERAKELAQQKYIQEQEQQSLSMSVERFAIPEILFKPSDIGLVDSFGLAETIVQSIELCDDELRAAMYHNIVLTGGNVMMPGFKERVEMEVRAMAPDNYVVRVFLPEDPVHFAWQGAHEFVKQKEFMSKSCITKMQWEASKTVDAIDQSLSWESIEKDHSSNGLIVL